MRLTFLGPVSTFDHEGTTLPDVMPRLFARIIIKRDHYNLYQELLATLTCVCTA